MMKKLIYLMIILPCILFLSEATAQFSFTDKSSQLLSVTAFHSGCAVAVVDMNNDGLDDIVRLNQGNDIYIEYQQIGGKFISKHIGLMNSVTSSWGMCIADVDHNGYKDIVADVYRSMALIQITVFKIDALGLMSKLVLPNSNFFMQNLNCMDINNDGWEDIFACDDNAASHIYVNDGTGNFTESNIINFNVTTSDESGNYGSVWTDFDNDGDIDLYVAKCRQGVVDPNDPRRIDLLFVNNGDNTYTEMAAAHGVANKAQTWTANFGDIDNDGDLDLLATNVDEPSQIFENNGTGHYTDITSSSGFFYPGIPMESIMEDFDNDGFVDILVTGAGSEGLYKNNGNKTFTMINGAFNFNNILSFATGDLNHDGKIDLYGSYGNMYTTPSFTNDILWVNSINNNNNFITFNLTGTVSNKGALGARAEIYGTWGKQIREVHAGESYGTCNTTSLHFGIGTATQIDSAIIRWPSGNKTKIESPDMNQFYLVIENQCTSASAYVSASGSLTFCHGDSVVLTANHANGYLWSTGDTSQSITVYAGGSYAVTINPGTTCSSTTPSIKVIVDPEDKPLIQSSSPTNTFCVGDVITLTASPASSYLWSTGETSQFINVSTSGKYYVTSPGLCKMLTSDTVNVEVFDYPAAPVALGTILSSPAAVTLTASGNNDAWFNAKTGGRLLAVGNSLTTSVIQNDTTFYVEDRNITEPGIQAHVGQQMHSGDDYGSASTNGNMRFDVQYPCIIKKVKVYTDIPGNRLIELRNSTGNTILQSIMVDIPADSSYIDLNFSLEPGSYRIGTNTVQNNIVTGTNSPRLKRSNKGVQYPYTIQNVLSIITGSQGGSIYFYFYDWDIESLPKSCASERTAVSVTINNTGVTKTSKQNNLDAYPNPASSFIHIDLHQKPAMPANIELYDITGRMIISQTIQDSEFNMNLRDVEKGIYLLKVNGFVQKIVVE